MDVIWLDREILIDYDSDHASACLGRGDDGTSYMLTRRRQSDGDDYVALNLYRFRADGTSENVYMLFEADDYDDTDDLYEDAEVAEARMREHPADFDVDAFWTQEVL